MNKSNQYSHICNIYIYMDYLLYEIFLNKHVNALKTNNLEIYPEHKQKHIY